VDTPRNILQIKIVPYPLQHQSLWQKPRHTFLGGPPGALDARDGGGRGHRHPGADPRLRGGGQDGHRREGCSRRRLLEDRLRGVVHRHGPRRPPAARGAGGRGLAAHVDLRGRHRRTGRAEDHAIRAAAVGDRAVRPASASAGDLQTGGARRTF